MSTCETLTFVPKEMGAIFVRERKHELKRRRRAHPDPNRIIRALQRWADRRSARFGYVAGSIRVESREDYASRQINIMVTWFVVPRITRNVIDQAMHCDSVCITSLAS